MTGSGPSGSGPVPRPEVEAARRRLYAPTAAPGAVAEYERLAAAAEPETTGDAVEGPGALAGPRRRTLRRLLTIAVAGTAVSAAVAFPRPVPDLVALPPRIAGESLVAYSRSHVDGTGPGIISYQPEGYSVFRADGRAIRVDLICAGIGDVLISAGRRFRFSCGREQASFTKIDRRIVRDPFVVMGTTRGDVVWSVRISAVPVR